MNENDRPKQAGQSIILVAVAMVALVIFVAIAVDASDAYVHRRTAQNAADAAALAGAQELGGTIGGGGGVTDSAIKAIMNEYAERNQVEDTNGIPADDVNTNVIGYYLDKREVRLAEVGAGTVPKRAVGIEAVTFMTAPTFFGGIVGFQGYPVQAEAAVVFDLSCTGEECMLPIAIHTPVLLTPTTQLTCYNMWDGYETGNFGWLNWSLQSTHKDGITYTYSCKDEYILSIAAELGISMTLVDDCSVSCLDINMDPRFCQRIDPMHIKVGDWVGGAPGVKDAAAVRYWLDDYIVNDRKATILVYDDIKGKGGCGKLENRNGYQYRVAGFACFIITGYRLSQGQGYVECDLEMPSGVEDPDLLCGPERVDATFYQDPMNCIDYPGTCKDVDGNPCDYWESGEYNRITGILVSCIGGTSGRCTAIGNLFSPMLTR
jgi:hypothetical protein